MYDPDVFAVLIPVELNASKAFRLDANKARFVHGVPTSNCTGAVARSRVSTPAENSPELPGTEADCYAQDDRLVLRFSCLPLNPLQGFRLGTDPKSDIVLGQPGVSAISRRHCRIDVDESHRIWLHDSNSKRGTAVEYLEGQMTIRRRDRWILSYSPRQSHKWPKMKIHMSNLSFHIVFPNHQAGYPEYMENLHQFRFACNTAVPPIGHLGIESEVSTAAPSQPYSPGNVAVYVDDGHIGRGSFAEVRRVIKARDGLVYAAKKCHPPPSRNTKGLGKRSRSDSEHLEWVQKVRQEYELMRENVHPNLMPVMDFLDEPEGPSIIMPYYPAGNLADYGSLTDRECAIVLLQLLCGLQYLHSRGVVHRDLKLENLLVTQEPFNVVIADFGLSKHSDDERYTTFCGTLNTMAPEVFPNDGRTYGTKVDVWSAAVIVVKLYLSRFCESPSLPRLQSPTALRKWSAQWTEMLQDMIDEEDEDGDQVIDLLRLMLRPEPNARPTAEECLQHGCDNGLFVALPEGGFVLASTGSGSGANTPTQPRRERSGAPTPSSQMQTIILQPQVSLDSFTSGETGPVSRQEIESSLNRSARKRAKSSGDQPDSESESETEYYAGCWFDPLHSLGGGSSLVRNMKVVPGEAGGHSTSQARGAQGLSHPGASLDYLSDFPGSQPLGGTTNPMDNRKNDTLPSGLVPAGSQNKGAHDSKEPISTLWADVEEENTGVGSDARPQTVVHQEPRPYAPRSGGLSTRDVFRDREGFVYVVVRQNAISMRTVDDFLNGTEICRAAGLQEADRTRWLRQLKKHTTISIAGSRRNSWVPFRDGVFLSQVLGLEPELEMLFGCSRTAVPGRHENYLIQSSFG